MAHKTLEKLTNEHLALVEYQSSNFKVSHWNVLSSSFVYETSVAMSNDKDMLVQVISQAGCGGGNWRWPRDTVFNGIMG